MPRVSVVICVYNGAPCVGRALDSVFTQDFDGVEVIVVDDGSTDDTPAVLNPYRDRAQIIRQENQGLAGARNAGVAAGRGEYVAFIDADDVWLPGRVAKTVAALDRAPNAVLAYSNAILVDAQDRPLAQSYVPADKAYAPALEELLGGWWPILPSTVTIRRKTIEACGGFSPEYRSANGYEDVFFFLRAREQGAFAYVPEPLISYRLAPLVERMTRYASGFKVFARQVSERYGAAGRSRIRAEAKSISGLLNTRGMLALMDGEPKLARRALSCALRYDPFNRRTILRLMRAYLPLRLAIAMGSRRWRALPGAPEQRSGASRGDVFKTW